MADAPGSPGQVSSFKIKISYWYVSNKILLRKVLAAFLILLSVIFYGYSVYRALTIFVVEGPAYKQDIQNLSHDLIDYDYFRVVNKPQELQIVSFDAINLGEGRYDFVMKVRNPNEKQVADEALIELIIAGNVVAETTTFVYPGEEKYVAIFGQEVDRLSNPILSIAQTKWRRVNNFAEIAPPRLVFDVENIDFKNARDSGIKGELNVSTLSFDITNDTAYSYWNVGVHMALLANQKVAAANYVSLDNFKSGETREVEVRFYEAIPSVSFIEVLPEIDILSESSYIPVE